jgi:hypothetical protein
MPCMGHPTVTKTVPGMMGQPVCVDCDKVAYIDHCCCHYARHPGIRWEDTSESEEDDQAGWTTVTKKKNQKAN